MEWNRDKTCAHVVSIRRWRGPFYILRWELTRMLKFEGSNGKSCEFQAEAVKVSDVLSELGLLKKALAGKVGD